MKRVRPLLEDMLHYARRAMEIAGQAGEGSLAPDDVRSLAVQRCLEIIGEAANAVPTDIHARFPDIPFRQAIAMRHRIIHGYSRIDTAIIEATIGDDLPGLIAAVERALAGGLIDD
jgi:uncharacterized protein with HEPN domain